MPELDLNLWLKPEDVDPEIEIEFTDSGERGEIPAKPGETPTETFEIGVKLPNGMARVWTMNKTSQRAVAQKYSANTDLWVGKKTKVFVSTQNVQGTMKKIIYARVPQ